MLVGLWGMDAIVQVCHLDLQNRGRLEGLCRLVDLGRLGAM